MIPVSKHFGSDTGNIRVRFHNGTAVVDGHIVKQLGPARYKVSDGQTEHVIRLAQTPDEVAALAPGLGTIRCGRAAPPAAFAVTYRVRAVTLSQGGSGYTAGETLTVVGGSGPAASVAVGAVDENGAVMAIGVTTRGGYTDLPGTLGGASRALTVTGGSGSGLTVAATFEVASVQVTSGGAGFKVGDALKATATGALIQPVLAVARVDANGAATAITVRSAGNFAGPVAFGSTVVYGHVKRLTDRTCTTVEDVTYDWQAGETAIERI